MAPRGDKGAKAPPAPEDTDELYSSTAIDESGKLIQELLAESPATGQAQKGLWDLGGDSGLDKAPEQSSVATLWGSGAGDVNDNDATAANINAEEVLRAAMAHRVSKPEAPTPPPDPDARWKDLDDSHQTIDGGDPNLSLPPLQWSPNERTDQWHEPAAPEPAKKVEPKKPEPRPARRETARLEPPARPKVDHDTAPSMQAYPKRDATQLDERSVVPNTAPGGDAPLKLTLPAPGSLVPQGPKPQVQGPLRFVVPAAPHAPAPPPAAAPAPSGAPQGNLPPGASTFGRYVLLERVGMGGMADVRLACQTGARGFTKPCVIKRIAEAFLNDRTFREMFVEEAKACSLLQHPNIVRLLEFDEVNGTPYLALELVDGVNLHSLDALAGEDGLPLSVILDIGIETAAALHYAHEATGPGGQPLNMIHRDVSPQNVLVSRNGEVKLADFGIARFEGRMHHTAFGPPKGKLRYMAPEQLRFEKLDRRTDVFSLGVVLVEMMTGRALMPEGVIVAEDPPAIVRERLSRRAPQDLVEVLAASVALAPAQRPPSADVVRGALLSAKQRIDRPESIADYAQRVIAPAVPSAESAIFALLDQSGARPPEPPRPAPAPSKGGRRAIDLSESLLDEDGAGAFPTTALFVLRGRPPISAPDNLDVTHQSDEPGVDAFAPTNIPSRDQLDMTHEQDGPGAFPAPSPEPLAPLNDRGSSGFGPTLIRPDGASLKEQLLAAPPKSSGPPPSFKADPSFRKGVLKELGPRKSDPAPPLVAPPMPAPPPQPVSAPPPAPAPAQAQAQAPSRRARNRAIAIVAAIWIAAMVMGLLAFLSKR